ncbi:hypothetical protein [Acidihalobacter prosperus]|uniref:Uncharacterized protein n=1 Tax=Acidihalobacter prosperus TaxID=160660 RepID=A0A1A6C5W9_9GAMM|nr:hypothetical protein [Acidihalobacter prosperus]OBS09954.1 hypothetical protein Thpro_021004 [Acidihalobacter prosperus]
MKPTFAELLDVTRPLPQGHGIDGIVQWHCFRHREDAAGFVPSIRLLGAQQLVGGRTEDSLGPLWWVGVRVDNLGRWGNLQAVNKHGASA